MRIKTLSSNLKFKKGVWYAKNRRKISYPEEDLDYYSQLEKDSFWFKFRNRFIVEMIKNHSPKGTVVEIGSGNGYVAQAISKNNFDILLIEPNPKGVLRSKKRGLKKIICGSFEEIKFKNNSIEAVGIFDVLEHIKKDKLFIKRVKEKLAVNGKLYLTVPMHSFLWSEEDDHIGHFRRYSKKQLFNLLENSGLKVEYFSFCFAILLLPIFLFRTIPTKLGIKRKIALKTLKKEHYLKSKKLNKILEIWLKIELMIIKKGGRIPFGSSGLLVATNTKPTRD